MKLILSSLFLVLSAANALILDNPPAAGWASGETVTEHWQTRPADPAHFTLTLDSYASKGSHALIAIVETAPGSVTFTVPDVSAGDDNDIYAQTAPFAISQ
ncbi:hypothetical protein EVJ58_g2546 [Rhodofomes roseus]|uniref:Uncharacterized protein n=1 Tax=Rhodofomes roseus TaxID=34475 RepID=A0A4Y9YR10_9APHY|nr:hypothetical protein EVJ58_g2546 [Rhodofomes roseus]